MLEVGEWWMLIDLFQWWRICQCCPGHWLQEVVCSLSLREPSYQRPRLFTGFSDTLGIGSLPVCWWWSNNSPLTCLVLFSYEPARCFPGAYFAKITWKLRKICTYYITWLCFHTSNITSTTPHNLHFFLWSKYPTAFRHAVSIASVDLKCVSDIFLGALHL